MYDMTERECYICLEEVHQNNTNDAYGSEYKNNTSKSVSDMRALTTIIHESNSCLYTIHEECWQKWVERRGNTCIICLQPLTRELESDSDNDNDSNNDSDNSTVGDDNGRGGEIVPWHHPHIVIDMDMDYETIVSRIEDDEQQEHERNNGNGNGIGIYENNNNIRSIVPIDHGQIIRAAFIRNVQREHNWAAKHVMICCGSLFIMLLFIVFILYLAQREIQS